MPIDNANKSPQLVVACRTFIMALYHFVLVFILRQTVASSCPGTSNMTVGLPPPGHTLRIGEIKKAFRQMGLGVEGIVYQKALEIKEEMQGGIKKPFQHLIRGNLADPQLFGQKPLTVVRQLLALLTYPALLDLPQVSSVFPSDVQRKARAILTEAGAGSIGTYTDAWGMPLVRKHVASFISARDGGIPSDWRNIGLTNGVYDGTLIIMDLLQKDCLSPPGKDVGVMVSIPVYSLFSIAIAKLGFRQVEYKLNASNDWSLDLEEVEKSYNDAVCNCNCNIRAIAVINPGNPAGMVIRRKTMEEIIKFAHAKGMLIIADEIYQSYILKENLEFVSFKKVLMEMPYPYNETELIAFHGISKGYIAESGFRGGFFELVNIEPGVKKVLYKLMNLKLCANLLGQAVMDVLADPPKPGDDSYPLYIQETKALFELRKTTSKTFIDGINSIAGLHATHIEAGLVAFVKVAMSPASFAAAKTQGVKPDEYYALQLLETTGLASTPGSSFAMPDDQPYLRIVIPLDKKQFDLSLESLKTFHSDFTKKYP